MAQIKTILISVLAVIQNIEKMKLRKIKKYLINKSKSHNNCGLSFLTFPKSFGLNPCCNWHDLRYVDIRNEALEMSNTYYERLSQKKEFEAWLDRNYKAKIKEADTNFNACIYNAISNKKPWQHKYYMALNLWLIKPVVKSTGYKIWKTITIWTWEERISEIGKLL